MPAERSGAPQEDGGTAASPAAEAAPAAADAPAAGPGTDDGATAAPPADDPGPGDDAPTATEPSDTAAADEPPAVEPPAVERPADEPAAEPVTSPEPVAEEPAATDPPTTSDDALWEPAGEPPAAEPAAEVAAAPEAAEQPEAAEEPAAEEQAAEEPPTGTATIAPLATETPVTEEPVTEEPVTEEPVTETPVTEEPVTEEPVTEEPVAEEPVVEEPPAEQEPAAETPAPEGPAAEAAPVEAPAPSEPARRRPDPGPDAAPAAQVTAGLPRPPGPGRAARRLAAEQYAEQYVEPPTAEQTARRSAELQALAAERAATQAAIEKALAERAAADRAVEEQVARERARRPAVPIPAVVPDEPRSEAPPRGPAVVVARSNRLRRRVVGGLVALVVLLAAGLAAFVVTHRTGGPTATTAAPVPDAQLPAIGDPPPVLAALPAQAPQPDPQALARTLAPLLSASALGSGVGAQVVDVATGKVLLAQDAATPATPASTAKLLTSAAVLTTVDPESTLTTRVVAGATPGEVVLVGGGDPTLTRADTSPSYPGAASVRTLAAQVRAALGGAPVTRVVVDGSLYSGPATAGGWQPSDAPSTYAAPITAAMVDGGRTTATSGNRSGTPATDAGQALAAALGVPRAAVALGTAPAGARVLGSVHSAPIARIVEQALSQSDNVLAEALARQVALARHLPATFEGSAQGVVAALAQDGIDTTGVTMVDGSGLSRTDAVPPAVLAGVLTKTASGALPRAAAILSGLAVAGYDGTLADRGDSNPATAPGSVRAKTGTLLGVHGLAGTVVTADGRLLVFALLADHSTSGDTPAENALDQVASALAGCGCR